MSVVQENASHERLDLELQIKTAKRNGALYRNSIDDQSIQLYYTGLSYRNLSLSLSLITDEAKVNLDLISGMFMWQLSVDLSKTNIRLSNNQWHHIQLSISSNHQSIFVDRSINQSTFIGDGVDKNVFIMPRVNANAANATLGLKIITKCKTATYCLIFQILGYNEALGMGFTGAMRALFINHKPIDLFAKVISINFKNKI